MTSHGMETRSFSDGVPDVHHALVFCKRCSFPDSEGNLTDSLTVDHLKRMKGFTRPPLLDPLK